VAKNTLVFMSNAKLLQEKGLKPPTSWNDLLDPAYKGQIQTADARTSGTALTRILSIYYAFGRDETKTFDYQKKLHQNVQVYTKSGGGCTIPAALGQAIVCIAHMPDAMEAKKKGYDMVVTFPREGVAAVIEGVALVKGARNRELATKFIDWTFSKDMQDLLDKHQVYMLPTLPDASIDAGVAALMKEAKLLPVDLEWVGKNRKRLVERWVNEVIKE
jgi:iron(III) transport system substrate-binding protein